MAPGPAGFSWQRGLSGRSGPSGRGAFGAHEDRSARERLPGASSFYNCEPVLISSTRARSFSLSFYEQDTLMFSTLAVCWPLLFVVTCEFAWMLIEPAIPLPLKVSVKPCSV